jgi:hypothetical protein
MFREINVKTRRMTHLELIYCRIYSSSYTLERHRSSGRDYLTGTFRPRYSIASLDRLESDLAWSCFDANFRAQSVMNYWINKKLPVINIVSSVPVGIATLLCDSTAP